MIVRPASRADAAVIAELQNALLPTTTIEWATTPRTVEEVREWLAAHEVVLIAEDREEVVGVAAYGWFRDVAKWPGYRFVVENTVHVRQDRWGTGVGRELMHGLIAAARGSGLHAMIAAIDAGNLASIGFHERLGFVEVARMPEVGAKFGRWLDLVLLELRLDDRPAPEVD